MRGSYLCLGQAWGPITDFAFSDLAPKSARATRPSLFHVIADPAELRRRTAALFAAVTQGMLQSEPRQSMPLDQAAQAHADLACRRTTGPTVSIP
ncbi:hypothetical protein PANO111632_20010 [Paracoccus nototheniae]